MITTDLVCIVPVGFKGNPVSFSYPAPREVWEEDLANRIRRGISGPAEYELRPHRTCECCGASAVFMIDHRHCRCRKHAGRNPCLVEGCRRTAKASNGYANDMIICGTHWRALVPVGSPERRIYNRFFRRAKKYGWSDNSIEAFERFWRALVSRVRARARGDLDMAEIGRIMGWES